MFVRFGVVFAVLMLLAGVVLAQDELPLLTGDGGTATSLSPTSTPDFPPPTDDEWPSELELPIVLLWLFSMGGGATVSYWLMGKVSWLAGLPPELKRYTSMGLAALIACAAFVAAVALDYVPEPDGGQAWLEQLFAIAGLAVFGGQALHGRLQLRARLYAVLGVAQVTVTSADLVRMFIGDAAEDVDEFVSKVEAAGGIKTFLDEHVFYSSILPKHRPHVEAYYGSLALRNKLREVRPTAAAAAVKAGLPVTTGAWED